jgi:phospholipid transport system substrate-binding protein
MLSTIGRSLSLVLVAAALAAASAVRADELAPDALVKNVTLEVVDILAKDKDIRSGSQQKVIDLVEQKVLPHFDFTAMTRQAVAVNWLKATPEQKKRLTEEFKTLLVRTYSSALSSYRDQKFDFRPHRAKPDDADVTVQVRIVQTGTEPVSLDYDMQKTPAGWKVYDMRVAGVSLVANYRTEFANEVHARGVDGLIETLATKNRTLAQRAGKK